MKKLSIILIILLSAQYLIGQDYIYKTNGEKIAVKIIEKNSDFVLYRRHGIRNTNTLQLPINHIFMIDYEDGNIEKISENNFNSGDEHQINNQEITFNKPDVYETKLNQLNNQISEEEQSKNYKQSRDINNIEKAGKKRKEKKLINTDYDRNSLTILGISDNNLNINQIVNNLNVPPKYNCNDLEFKTISINCDSEQERNEILNELNKKEVGKNIISKWFNYDEMNGFNMELVKQRSAYDATDQEYYITSASKRGIAALKDQGLKLVDQSFLLVLGVKDLMTMEQFYNKNRTKNRDRIKNGFIGNVSGYLYKIDFNSNLSQQFFQDIWVEGFDIEKTSKLNKYSQLKVPVSFHSNYSAMVEGTQYNSNHVLGSKKQKSEIELLDDFSENAVSNILTLVEMSNDNFKVKSPIASVSPVKVKIGEKEGVKFDQRFFVYENRLDEFEKPYSHRVGVIRAKDIVDNRYITSGKTDESTFYQISGKVLDHHGMFVEQNDDLGFSISGGYIYKPVDYMDESGILLRVGYYPKHLWPSVLGKKSNWFKPGVFSSMYIYSDIIFHIENSERISYSGGIGNDLHFARNFKLSPYLGYGGDKFSDSDGSIGFIEGGLLFCTNLMHNVSFNLHGKSMYYYDIALLNLLGLDLEEISIGLNASIQVSF
jgi:hypothetical protein